MELCKYVPSRDESPWLLLKKFVDNGKQPLCNLKLFIQLNLKTMCRSKIRINKSH